MQSPFVGPLVLPSSQLPQTCETARPSPVVDESIRGRFPLRRCYLHLHAGPWLASRDVDEFLTRASPDDTASGAQLASAKTAFQVDFLPSPALPWPLLSLMHIFRAFFLNWITLCVSLLSCSLSFGGTLSMITSSRDLHVYGLSSLLYFME